MRDWPGPEHRALLDELALAMIAAERRAGRAVDRTRLARSIFVSRASLYAYLQGVTLPSAVVFDRLLAELGVEGDEARRLHGLRDRVEVKRRAGRRRGAPPVPVPRQLPPVAAPFVGRVADLALVRDLLGPVPRIVVVDGMAGAGKTTLAVQAAGGVAAQFPDGQLFADLGGFGAGEPVDPEEALLGFIIALGVPGRAAPSEIGARSAFYRSLLAGRRMLVVLDNARSAEQVRPLLPNEPGCATLVTSRNRLDGLTVREGARRVELLLPSAEEARLLLASRLPADRIAAEPDAADDLVALCARLPLAISVATAYVAGRPGSASLRQIVQDLRTARGALGLRGHAGGAGVAEVFGWSHDVLPEPARRLLRRLGLHPGPSIDRHGCAALAGAEATEATEALLAASLLREGPLGRFHLHDLLRAYAAERLADDQPAERLAAVDRMLDLYAATAARAGALIQPPAGDGAAPEHGPVLAGYNGAMAWFAAEIRTLRALVPLAVRYGRDERAWELAWTCTVFLRRTGRHRERVEMHQTALLAAERSGDLRVRATALRLLADALKGIGSHGEAVELLERSIRMAGEAGFADGIRQAHLSLVRAFDRMGHYPEAFDHAVMARRLAEAGDTAAVADGCTALAKQHGRLEQFGEALVSGAEAAARYRELGNREGLANVLSAMGRAECGLGRHRAAIGHFAVALELDLALGDRYWAARTLVGMAEAHELGGAPALAAACRKRAERLLDDRPQPVP
ncbi:tetratricopeptide repeat protein [Dactylosporangium sp. NPDC050688]|uniref:ATP-binding protein n=1 Tax=Dactylosporangium sp. NPDC050688 TaxID=3157217 RepID=UPI0033DF20DF